MRPALRSRSLRQLKKSTPGGRHTTLYERRRPETAKCASCKGKLSGVPSLRPAKLSKLAKTKHSPNRAYGGNLCHSCLKVKIKERVLNLD
ncbi:MAG TPA: 50S ribosomal protein L34e [archaeon]|nr:50S ribosomal protein L34e [archaeon]